MDHLIELLELLHGLVNDGLSWATGVALVLGLLKIVEGRRKRWEQREVNRKLDALGAHIGVPGWNGASTTAIRGPMSLKPWSKLSQAGLRRGYQLRRKRIMNNGINWVTLIVALLGAAKLVLQVFGIDVITDDMIDGASNFVAAAVTFVGVIMSHRKKDELSAAEKGYMQ